MWPIRYIYSFATKNNGINNEGQSNESRSSHPCFAFQNSFYMFTFFLSPSQCSIPPLNFYPICSPPSSHASHPLISLISRVALMSHTSRKSPKSLEQLPRCWMPRIDRPLKPPPPSFNTRPNPPPRARSLRYSLS